MAGSGGQSCSPIRVPVSLIAPVTIAGTYGFRPAPMSWQIVVMMMLLKMVVMTFRTMMMLMMMMMMMRLMKMMTAP